MNIQQLNESINDYFYNVTFYKAAKNHFPELKRIVAKFFQKNGMNISQEYNYSDIDSNIDFPALKDIKDKKLKKEKMTKAMSDFNIPAKDSGKPFFSSGKSYDGVIKFPIINYKGFSIVLKIATNETFFEDGHDLELDLKKDTTKHFSEKIDLMRPVEVVLENILAVINNKISTFENVESDVKEKEERTYSSSLIRNIYDYTLGKTVKRKKDSTTIVDSKDDLIEFYLRENTGRKQTSSVATYKNPSFDISVKIKGFTETAIMKKYPEVATQHKRLKDYKNTGYRSYSSKSESMFPKFLNQEHEIILNRFKVFCERVLKLGYYPFEYKRGYKSKYGNTEQNAIVFLYSASLKKLATSKWPKDLELASSKLQSYIENIEKSLFNFGKDSFIKVSQTEQYVDKKIARETFLEIKSFYIRRNEGKTVDPQDLQKILDKYSKSRTSSTDELIIKDVFEKLVELVI